MTSNDGADGPAWFPAAADDVEPMQQQQRIIESTEYPMRVLAGAGTGKTFTMVRKIEHLIDEGGGSPDRILALTFTNNAADAMREKLHAKLGTSGYDVDTYTYHSICHALLQEYAYHAGLDPDFDVATDAEKYAVILDVLDAIEYRTVKPNVYGPDSYGSGAATALATFVRSMKRSGISPEAINEYLGPVDRLYELATLPEKLETVASDTLGGRSVSSVLEGLPAMRDELLSARDAIGNTGIEGSVSAFLDELVTVSESLIQVFQAHENGDRDLSEAAHKVPKYLFGGYKSGAPAGIPALGLELTTSLDDFIADCQQARDLVSGYAAYEATMAAYNLLDFDDLVVETVALLETAAGEEIASRWDYVFCDEFQDTDRLQFKLVESLVRDDNLFVVGDDDQAIYEWRGANVANITTELDRSFGARLVDEPLTQNFRSRQPILDLANTTLGKLDNRVSAKTLTRVDEPDYEGDCVVTIDEAVDEGDRADQLVTAVQNLLSGAAPEIDRAYDPGDIALLVRKHKHAEPIVHAFEDAGIPYQVAGDLATESIGVGTVIAYLKALARPETDEVSWNRVLTMRYRLLDADLRHLNIRDDTLLSALLSAPLDEFVEPERIQTVRAHVDRLLDCMESASLAHLYRELKEVTDIEWYLSEQDRRNLGQLETVIEQFGDATVQPPLTEAFIEALRHHDEVFSENGGMPTDQPELAADAINVMTIHKSKGLDFPIVIIPRVTETEWAPGSRSYDVLQAALLDGPEAAFAQDFVAHDARETRRVLHVGLTRAEDMLILHGRRDEEDESDDGEMTAFLREMLGATPAWDPDSSHLPIWQDIQECLPPSAANWTDSLASTIVGTVGGEVIYDDEAIAVEHAKDHVLRLGDQMLDGTLERSASSRLHVDVLEAPPAAVPLVKHSYTSLSTFEECPRKYYLDYVVNAFPGYSPGEKIAWEDVGPSQRTVGVLFHETAEIAAREGARTRNEWYEICDRVGTRQRAQGAIELVRECIDHYFELAISEWEVVDAEREFELDIDGGTLVGLIDAVYRTPEDTLVVIDYKATQRERDIDANRQLPLYLLACRDLYDEPVRNAGYAFVGPLGPKLTIRDFERTDVDSIKREIEALVAAIATLSYEPYTADSHCQWCDHNDLPCAAEVLDDRMSS